MSKEEVIKKINEIRKEYSTMDGLTEYVKAIDMILDLVNKQQKEIEELKEKDKEKKAISQAIIRDTFIDRYISKDKITEKIKKLEDYMILFTNDKEKFNRYKYARNILEELLEENINE